MSTLHVGAEGTGTDGVNGYVGIGTTAPNEKLEVSGNIMMTGGGWNNGHIVLGAYHLWMDNTGKLRYKNSAPTSSTDGNLV